jgi:peptide/nickel transport system substrate-binding protein
MFQRRRKMRVAGAAAVVAVALLAAGCGSSGGSGASSSSSAGPSVKGAVATLPNINGAGANCIYPFQGFQCYSVTNYETFQYLMVRPLYMFGGNSNTSISVNYPLSPANAPVYSDGGKTVVINMKGWKWSNGETVNANSLVLNLNLLEAEKANYAGYTTGLLPDNMVSYKATGPEQVTLQLKQAYSTLWFTYNQLAILTPMPQAWDVSATGAKAGSGGCLTDSASDSWAKCKAVYTYMTAQNKDTATYATNPLWQVVDGPFKLTSYNVNGNYNFAPNTKYSGSPKPSVSELKFVSYTSDTAIYTALKTGALSTGGIPSTDLTPAVGNTFLPATNPLASTPGGGYTLQPALSFTIGFAYTNFNNPTYGPAFKQLYFRQALQMLDNQKGMDTAVGRGYSTATTAGVPVEPISQWVSSDMTANGGQGPYPYDPAKAKALLASHGWKVVGGVLTCESAGSGASNCGAGVAKGTQAKFSMLYTSGISTQQSEVDILKSGWGLAGIQLSPQGETFNTLLGDATPCKSTAPSCKWTFLYLGGWGFNGPGFEPTGEPLYQTGASSNSGGYSDPTMDSLINQTHTSSSIDVFHTYANYTANQLPVLWMPWPVNTVAVSSGLHNVTQNPLSMFFPEYWTCSTKSC